MDDIQRIDELEYILAGVMHSVDKWLEGDEFEQDEVNRAATMREKVLRIIEAKDARIRELEKKLEEFDRLQSFKIGDTVWVYDFMWGIIPCEVDEPYHCRCGEVGGCTYGMYFGEKDIGKYIFATKEEAEDVWRKKE